MNIVLFCLVGLIVLCSAQNFTHDEGVYFNFTISSFSPVVIPAVENTNITFLGTGLNTMPGFGDRAAFINISLSCSSLNGTATPSDHALWGTVLYNLGPGNADQVNLSIATAYLWPGVYRVCYLPVGYSEWRTINGTITAEARDADLRVYLDSTTSASEIDVSLAVANIGNGNTVPPADYVAGISDRPSAALPHVTLTIVGAFLKAVDPAVCQTLVRTAVSTTVLCDALDIPSGKTRVYSLVVVRLPSYAGNVTLAAEVRGDQIVTPSLAAAAAANNHATATIGSEFPAMELSLTLVDSGVAGARPNAVLCELSSSAALAGSTLLLSAREDTEDDVDVLLPVESVSSNVPCHIAGLNSSGSEYEMSFDGVDYPSGQFGVPAGERIRGLAAGLVICDISLHTAVEVVLVIGGTSADAIISTTVQSISTPESFALALADSWQDVSTLRIVGDSASEQSLFGIGFNGSSVVTSDPHPPAGLYVSLNVAVPVALMLVTDGWAAPLGVINSATEYQAIGGVSFDLVLIGYRLNPGTDAASLVPILPGADPSCMGSTTLVNSLRLLPRPEEANIALAGSVAPLGVGTYAVCYSYSGGAFNLTNVTIEVVTATATASASVYPSPSASYSETASRVGTASPTFTTSATPPPTQTPVQTKTLPPVAPQSPPLSRPTLVLQWFELLLMVFAQFPHLNSRATATNPHSTVSWDVVTSHVTSTLGSVNVTARIVCPAAGSSLYGADGYVNPNSTVYIAEASSSANASSLQLAMASYSQNLSTASITEYPTAIPDVCTDVTAGAAPAPSTGSSSPSSGGSSTSGIIAAVVMPIILLLVILIVLFLYFRRKRSRGKAYEVEEEPDEPMAEVAPEECTQPKHAFDIFPTTDSDVGPGEVPPIEPDLDVGSRVAVAPDSEVGSRSMVSGFESGTGGSTLSRGGVYLASDVGHVPKVAPSDCLHDAPFSKNDSEQRGFLAPADEPRRADFSPVSRNVRTLNSFYIRPSASPSNPERNEGNGVSLLEEVLREHAAKPDSVGQSVSQVGDEDRS